MPQNRCGLPTLLALLTPKLEGLLPAEHQPPFEQWNGLTRQLTHGNLQLQTPAVSVAGPNVQHLAAVAEPNLLKRHTLSSRDWQRIGRTSA